MSLTRRLDRRLGAATARRLLDATLLAALLAAVWLCVASGLPPAAVLAAVIAAAAFEYVASSAATDRVLHGTDWRADGVPPGVEAAVADLSAAMGIDPPLIRVDPDGDPGVNVLRIDSGPVLLLSGSLPADLEGGPLRGVLAHELAHLSLGHLRWLPVRESITHVVGFAVLWAVFLQGLWPPAAAVIGTAYLAAGAARINPVNAVLYVAGSLGTVVVLRVVSTYAGRLEECRADDLAAAHTSAADFCTGLARVGTATGPDLGGHDAVAGTYPRPDQRGFPERFTAAHPTVDYRLRRLGVAVEDAADAAA